MKRSCSAPSASRPRSTAGAASAAALAQDVDDALVGGGQRGGFRAAPRTPARPPSARRDEVDARGIFGEHGLDFVRPSRPGRAAIAAQPVEMKPNTPSAVSGPSVPGGKRIRRALEEVRRARGEAPLQQDPQHAERVRGAVRTDPCRRSEPGRCRTCRPASPACRPARRFARPALPATRRRRTAASSAARSRRPLPAARRRARRSSGPSGPAVPGTRRPCR